MILADTSVWVEHIHRPLHAFESALLQRRIVVHPFVIGELVCGNLPDRARFIAALERMPQTDLVEHAMVMKLIEARRLMGLGIGWMAAHLLASAIQAQHDLWTRDRALVRAAEKSGVSLVN